ncbi:MAG: ATP-binding protein [Proteobacteria bacterium]|nr:ATP-binding protein [Pseudomonadota bacterium]
MPNLPDEKFRKIGNASIDGATIALYSITRRRKLEQFINSIDHVQLEKEPDFFEYFVNGCQYGHV